MTAVSAEPAASRVRWAVTDASATGAQQTLFDEPEREIGRGEFRGLEFVHVRARSIINRVDSRSPMPFQHTINAYRGCSHRCTYCMGGDTPILMADGRTKRLADIRTGDRVYGTERRGSYRRYVVTDVLDHWSTVRQVYRVTLEDRTQIIASGDHRFLSNRGWKHVIRAERPLQRPFLTINNKLIGTGRFAEPPKHDNDYRRGYLCGVIRGDGHIGHYRYPQPNGAVHQIHDFRLAMVDSEALERTRDYLNENGIETREFVFQAATSARKRVDAIRRSGPVAVAAIEQIIAWPSDPSDQWRKGFLAGIFDAEGGCNQSALRIFNTDRVIVEHIRSCLESFGFRFVNETMKGTNRPVECVRIIGGLRERLRFFLLVDPAITRKRTFEGMALKSDAPLGVVSIESLGIDIPMYDITTGTGDFIADGVVSHNCFARPTHRYLDLDPRTDFDRVIVVKVNAIERLRAELAPKKWAGDSIAMGTNTDPYQRAEGKYKLTRGIIEVLGTARNPFSILTKGTLVLRDLDLLVEAAERTRVSLAFSIGTLDDDVWGLTEPGTPHPLKRVEAVAKLNDAGIPCSVLVGPVLPGLSDEPGQIDAVVRACLEAGAHSISPVLLHLRPGVREHYLESLAEHRPDLMAHYQQLYSRGSYAPKAARQRVSELVRAAIGRHGGLRRPPASPKASARLDRG